MQPQVAKRAEHPAESVRTRTARLTTPGIGEAEDGMEPEPTLVGGAVPALFSEWISSVARRWRAVTPLDVYRLLGIKLGLVASSVGVA
jgi:hypothetical protein